MLRNCGKELKKLGILGFKLGFWMVVRCRLGAFLGLISSCLGDLISYADPHVTTSQRR
jgi:hypothetical protein